MAINLRKKERGINETIVKTISKKNAVIYKRKFGSDGEMEEYWPKNIDV